MANYFDNIKNAPKHVVAESSRLKATTAGHIYDLKMIADTDNGTIVAIGDHIEGQLFKAKAYAKGEQPYLVLTPPLAYNGRRGWSDEQYFYNAEGEVARAYELHVGDIYTISEAGLTGTPAVGAFINAANVASAEAGEAGFVGEIIEEVAYSNGKAYRVLVKAL